jgi:hypothetical protein
MPSRNNLRGLRISFAMVIDAMGGERSHCAQNLPCTRRQRNSII